MKIFTVVSGKVEAGRKVWPNNKREYGVRRTVDFENIVGEIHNLDHLQLAVF